MKCSLQSLRCPPQLQINAALSSSICSCSVLLLCTSLQVRSQLPYACCLLTIVIEMSVYKQLLPALLQAWLVSAVRKGGRVMPEWQLPLRTAGALPQCGKLRQAGAAPGGCPPCSPVSRISYWFWSSFSSP